MYYRRKVILALIERFGGKLKPTDFQKLMLVFTRRQQKPVFEFVPYKFGAFSFRVRADKQTMIKYGQLKDEKDWVFSAEESYITQIKRTDRQILEDVWKQFNQLSTEKLVKHTYKEFPFYATRSEIAEKILDPSELQLVEMARPINTAKKMYTIGYEGISAEEYMNKLYLKNIRLLVDVRKNSFSMKYGFSKTQLKGMCEKMGIRFMHIPELGIDSGKRKKLESETDYKALFNEYESETLPEREEQLSKLNDLFKEYKRVAITCFEKEHTSCHRHKISDYLEREYGVAIEHL